ncbi:NAD(P)-binding protein [Clavulina sp. PMI_390]|nr:NAD(P)-binding protein [Clavulina sp. PMI_390]
MSPPSPPKEQDALKFGILGAADVAGFALINPVKSHPGAIVEAVAARDHERAKKFAKKHGISRTFPSYQALLDDPSIDVVYIALPNSHHFEWALKSLRAGKHVLVEKPMVTTTADAVKLFAVANELNLVIMEAFHLRFHPAVRTMKVLADSGRIGSIQRIESMFATPSAVQAPPNVRNYSLGGGAMINGGCYAVCLAQYILDGAKPLDMRLIKSGEFTDGKKSDQNTYVECDFPSPQSGASQSKVTALLWADIGQPSKKIPIPPMEAMLKIYGDRGSLSYNNYMAPNLFHTITVTSKTTAANGKVKETHEYIKAYTFQELDPTIKGESWWSNYRYQLEAFVDKIRGRTPQTFINEAESVGVMEVLERAYELNGLGPRLGTNYKG